MTEFSTLLQQGNAWLFVPSAILLGALHGLEPGHSKTMMAAFIVAIRGTITQAVLLGLSATLSHTAVVWVVALTGLYYGGQLNAESTEPYFQVASAVLIVGVAVWMMWRTWRLQQGAGHAHSHDPHGNEVKRIDTGHGAVRLEIFEDGAPARFRLSRDGNGGHSWDADQVQIETERPAGRRQLFAFTQRDGFVERDGFDNGVVQHLQPIIAHLYQVTVHDFVLLVHALPVDIAAVVTAEIEQQPIIAGLGQARVTARDIALGQTDRILFCAADRVIVANEVDDGLTRLVVLDRQLPHRCAHIPLAQLPRVWSVVAARSRPQICHEIAQVQRPVVGTQGISGSKPNRASWTAGRARRIAALFRVGQTRLLSSTATRSASGSHHRLVPVNPK